MFLLPFSTPEATDSANAPAGGFGGYTMYILIGVALVFMLWWSSRSRKRQAAQAEQKRASMRVGATAQTIGGIVGTIVAIDDDHIVLETAPGNRITFISRAIARVIDDPVGEAEDVLAEASAQSDSSEPREIEPGAAATDPSTDRPHVAPGSDDTSKGKGKGKKAAPDAEPDGDTPGYYQP